MSYKDKPQIKLYKYENSAFVLQAIIDDFQEVSFEHNLYEAGQFTISINYNIPNALKFERGLFVQFGSNPYDFGEIITVQDSIGEDGKGSQIRTITGYDARYLLKRRVIKNMNSNGLWVMTGKGEIVLRSLIQDQCGSGAEAKRQLPITNVIPATESALGNEFSVSESFTNLYEVCKTIATQSEIGWRIKFDGTLTLEVYEGQDLSQTVRFDTNFESLANGEFSDSAESYTNAIYIGGKGQNDDRDIYEGEDGTPEGLDRFEAWDNQSSMTTESEYEAEALSMLTQYGQTLTMNGNGLAKCPYVFREQYDIGDIVTVAFSGKSATAQILAITEHWIWSAYDISFAFGKPQNNLSDQLQLMLRKIQEASNKTNSTDSVRWYTIPTDSAMPKADVTYNTIGFQGTCAEGGSTFTLYLDTEKTGAKTYHVYFKQLAGGNLTLTTGRSGATDLVLNSGTYVAIIYVDENGNVTSQGATPTSTITSGNNQPATSSGVAGAISSEATARDTAISNALALPTDAVLHYSFDEVPSYPDGSADVRLLNNNTYQIQGGIWKLVNNGGTTFSNVNGNIIATITSGAGGNGLYISANSSNNIIKVKIKISSLVGGLRILNGTGTGGVTVDTISSEGVYDYTLIFNLNAQYKNFYIVLKDSTSSAIVELLEIYIGDGSYATPVIDNVNGQNNGVSYGEIANQGISGKGVYFPSANQYISLPTSKYPAPTSNTNISISVWLNIPTSYTVDYSSDSTNCIKPIISVGAYAGLFGIVRNNRFIQFSARDSVSSKSVYTAFPKGEWFHFVVSYNGSTHKGKVFLNGNLIGETQANIADYQFGSSNAKWLIWSNTSLGGSAVVSTNQPATIDDLLIFNRALSEQEVLALYLNKGNTPKYFPIPTNEIKQNSLELATSGGVFTAINKLNCFMVTFTSSLLNQCWGYYVKCGSRVFVRLKFILTSATSDWQPLAPAKSVPTPTSPFSISADGKTGASNSIYIYASGGINQAGGGGMSVGTYDFNFDYETTD